MRQRQVWFLILAGLFVPVLSFSQDPVGIPSLTIREGGKSKPLELLELEVSVEVEGFLVETIYELEFFNHTSRRQEGEFSIQLPSEATVSTYALDIRGEMRPGVSVEKDKARRAYESIKRRQVDPGLVEREKGNVYRTRIFPIEPKQSKRVRIGFIHRLPKGGKYVLPLIHKKSVKQFTCIAGGSKDTPALSGDKFAEPIATQPGVWEWEATECMLDTTLTVQSYIPTGPKSLTRIETQEDGSSHFVVQGILSPQKSPAKVDEKWSNVRLIWDASFSGRWRDHETDFAALTKIWKWIGNSKVTVQILSLELSDPVTFDLKDGGGKAIKDHLEGISFDGAADFSLLAAWDGPTLLVTDGVASSSIWMPDPANPLHDFYVLSSSADQVASGLLEPGGVWVDLDFPNWFEIFRADEGSVRVEGLPKAEWDIADRNGQFIVSGRMPKGFKGKVRIDAFGRMPIVLDSTDPRAFSEEWNLTRRIWAQQRLQTLEWERNPAKITEFAKEERLVSDHTSLIVLETFQDHLTFRIPPPEPEVLEVYHRELELRKTSFQSRVVSNWRRKLAWYDTRFPWLDAELETEVATVGVWVKSSRKAFPQEKQNNAALAPFEKWLPKAEAIIHSKETLKTGPDFQTWKGKLDQCLVNLNKIRSSGKAAEEGDNLHVSVRGFVRDRGIYSAEAPYHLRQSVIDAGGVNYFGSLARIYLYRDAERTGYNLKSLEAKPVLLRWGDMVVIEADPPRYSRDGFEDPFSDPFFVREPAASGGGPAVFEQSGASKRIAMDSSDPFGDPSSKEAKPTEVAMSGSFMQWEAPTSKGLDKQLVKALSMSADPVSHYRDLLSGDFGKGAVSIATNIEIARFLYEKDLDESGFRVLSNLCEIQSNRIEATRSLAYWLAEFGDEARAADVLQSLVVFAPDEETRALLHFDIGRISGDVDSFRKVVESELRSNSATSLASIALTDYFARGGKSNGTLSDFDENGMPADVRIVVTIVGGTVVPLIHEPEMPPVVTRSGSLELGHGRAHEFILRRAWLGSYKLSATRWHVDEMPVTLYAEFFIRWNSDREEKLSKTLLMDGTKLDLDGIEFGWE